MKTVVPFIVLCLFYFVDQNSAESFYDRQKAILNLFQHVYQSNVKIEHFDEVNAYKFDPEKFNDPHVYERYLNKRNENGIHEFFSLANVKHLGEAIALYDVFVAAKDLATLYKVALVARYRVNPDLFIYSLTAAILHRTDMQDVQLPALYEIQPNYFFNSGVIQKAQQYKMQGFPGVAKDSVDDIYKVIIEANYTGQNFIANEESRLSYYTEDIGINSNYYYLHSYYPFLTRRVENIEKRAVTFLRYLKYMLSRYYLERLSNGLGKIPEFSWYEPIPTGYYPQLSYQCGVTYPDRNNFYKLANPTNYYDVNEVISIENLFRYELKDATPEKVFNLLGRYIMKAKQIFAGVSNKYAPSTFEHFQTAMRDPMYFQLFNRAFKLFPRNDRPYNVDEIKYDGVKIETVEMDKLVTYFDKFDADITNAVDVDINYDHNSFKFSKLFDFGRVSQHQGNDFVIKARQYRLNHLPFTYKLNVLSDKVQKVVVKIFLGPKHDEYGRTFDINENREHFYELDQYSVDLVEGKNVLARNCREFSKFSPDRTTFFDWYKNLLQSIEQNVLPSIQTPALHYYNYPWRMMLPRGKKNGLPVQFFFIIVPKVVEAEKSESKYFLYPLDRPIDEAHWNYDNMYYFDTNIFYKKENDIQNLH